MATTQLIKSYIAEAAVAGNLFVKPGANSDDNVLPAAGSTDLIIGATTNLGGDINKRVDVVMDGIADIQLGGSVTRGQKLTSDANGKGIAAAPGAGVNAQIGGIALASGVSGDIIPVLLNPSVMQG